LGLGLSAREILDFYKTKGPEIFPSTGAHVRAWTGLRRLLRPKFDAGALDAALSSVFGDRLLGESSCRLVIPSYDAVAGAVHVFKTRHDRRVMRDHTRRAAEVARATSAAPTYLPLFPSSWGQQFLDGGIWANCPSTVAILEAIAVLDVPLTEIQLLSVGTATNAFSINRQAAGGGLLQYRTGITELLQQAPAVGAWAQTKLLLRGREYRIDKVVAPNRFALDDARHVEELAALGTHDGRHHVGPVIEKFLGSAVVPFVPYE
jgi:hypothetical protein